MDDDTSNTSTTTVKYLLWQKESPHRHSPYTDIFSTMIKPEFQEFVANRLSDAQNEQVEKNDDVSARLQKLGARAYRKRKWQQATELYNIGVCTAENGSSNLRLAYKARSNCFTNRGMKEEANIDIDLSSEPPKKILKRCSDRIQNRKLSITSEMKRMFIPNKKFPNLASALQVRYNKKYGRHIVAKRDIPVGQTVAMDRQFAGVVCTTETKPRQAYCLTCFRTDANFIPCPNCTDAMFCSSACQQDNHVHRLECQSLFHRITSATVKLAIQMVLIAVEQFPKVNALIAFVRDIINDPSDDLNDLASDAFPSYGVMLKLKCCPTNSDIKRAYEAYEIMMQTLPLIQRYFDSISNQRFLMHLLIHHLGVIRMNGFHDTFGWTGNLHHKYIHDTISLLNHSCAPNAYYTNQQHTIGQLITVRPIKRGDQVFINYMGDAVDRLRDYRRQHIEKYWCFWCQCDRCEPVASQSEQAQNSRNMAVDPDFQYFQRHRDDMCLPIGNERRNRLKQVCTKILNRYGRIWSNELNSVTTAFMMMCLN